MEARDSALSHELRRTAMSDDEKAKLGYQMAIQMIMYEGQLIWKALALMVIINSLIFGIVVVLAQTYPGVSVRKFIPWLGIMLSSFDPPTLFALVKAGLAPGFGRKKKFSLEVTAQPLKDNPVLP